MNNYQNQQNQSNTQQGPDPDYFIRTKTFTNGSTGEQFANINTLVDTPYNNCPRTKIIYKPTRVLTDFLASAGLNLAMLDDQVLFRVYLEGFTPKQQGGGYGGQQQQVQQQNYQQPQQPQQGQVQQQNYQQQQFPQNTQQAPQQGQQQGGGLGYAQKPQQPQQNANGQWAQPTAPSLDDIPF